MAGGFFEELGKLVSLGVLHAQHVRVARAAAQLPEAEMLSQLSAYLKSLTPAQFSGFNISIAMEVQREDDPQLKQVLSWMLSKSEAIRNHDPGSVGQSSSESVTGGATFDENVLLMDRWYRAACGGQAEQSQRELRSHMEACTKQTFATFIQHVDQAIANIHTNIKFEGGGGSRFIEDQINYRLAKLATGQMDPQRAENIREYQRQLKFFGVLRELAAQEFAAAHAASM